MLETDDPREAIRAKDLPTQAAAARDLARMGTWSDLEHLLDLATTHKRTGMRLSAAAAAADILHRYRTGAAGAPLDADKIATILEWSRTTDPGRNPSALMLLAAFPDKRVIGRLGRLLRDPRADVRAGAAVAVRRMALSHTDLDPLPLRRAFGDWLTHRKRRPDAVAELARLTGDLGWSEHRGAVLDVIGLSGPVTEAANTAITRLDGRKEPETWSGLYTSDGLDVLEQAVEPRATSWMLVGDGHLALHDGTATPFSITDGGWLRCDALDEAARLIWAPRVDDMERRPAIQLPGRTWFRRAGKDLLAWLDRHANAITEAHRPATAALLAEAETLEGATGKRAVPIAHLLHGEAQDARDALAALTERARPRNDLFAWLGRAEDALGHSDAARDAYARYLDKARRNDPHRPHAEARLEALDG